MREATFFTLALFFCPTLLLKLTHSLGKCMHIVCRQFCTYVTFFFEDFDNDGYQELLVTADFGSSKMFWNTKQNSFRECTDACGLKAKQVKIALDDIIVLK